MGSGQKGCVPWPLQPLCRHFPDAWRRTTRMAIGGLRGSSTAHRCARPDKEQDSDVSAGQGHSGRTNALGPPGVAMSGADRWPWTAEVEVIKGDYPKAFGTDDLDAALSVVHGSIVHAHGRHVFGAGTVACGRSAGLPSSMIEVIRSALASSSSCSQILTTCQPAASRSTSASRSRSTFRRSLGVQ